MDRRAWLRTVGGAALAVIAGGASGQRAREGARVDEVQSRWKDFLAPGTPVPSPGERLALADAEWRKRLPPETYRVLRGAGTEAPRSSPLNGEKRPGVFACAG